MIIHAVLMQQLQGASLLNNITKPDTVHASAICEINLQFITLLAFNLHTQS